MEVLEVSTQFRAPICENEKITLACNAYMLQNAGNVTARINDNWTLRPCGTLSLGIQEIIHLFNEQMHISFVDGSNTTEDPDEKRVELIEIHLINEQLAHFNNC